MSISLNSLYLSTLPVSLLVNNLRRVTARVEILEMRSIKVAQPVHYRNEYPQWIPIGELVNATWTHTVERYRL